MLSILFSINVHLQQHNLKLVRYICIVLLNPLYSLLFMDPPWAVSDFTALASAITTAETTFDLFELVSVGHGPGTK